MSRVPEAGAALVVALVLVLAFTVLGHGALVLATAEAEGAGSLVRATRGRLVARSLLIRVVRTLATDTLPAVPVGGADTAAVAGSARRVLERLTPEFYLVSLEALPDAGVGATSSAARPGAALWAADPLTRVGGVLAVVSAGEGVVGADRVVSDDFLAVAPEDGPWCDPYAAALDSLAAIRPAPAASGSLPAGAGEGAAPRDRALAVGRLRSDTVAARLDPFPPGAVTPLGSSGPATCADDPVVWGSPTDPLGPCGQRRVGLRVEGSLDVQGGEGQGVLAVSGDLAVRGGAVLSGLVLVGGDLLVDGASVVRGLVRVGGTATIAPTARVVGAACPVLLGLHGVPVLRRPVRLPGPMLTLR